MHGWYQNEEAQELSAFAEFAYDRCLQYDLHLSAVVLIGRAAEGAWIELDNALQQANLPATKLADPLMHIGKRINESRGGDCQNFSSFVDTPWKIVFRFFERLLESRKSSFHGVTKNQTDGNASILEAKDLLGLS